MAIILRGFLKIYFFQISLWPNLHLSYQLAAVNDSNHISILFDKTEGVGGQKNRRTTTGKLTKRLSKSFHAGRIKSDNGFVDYQKLRVSNDGRKKSGFFDVST